MNIINIIILFTIILLIVYFSEYNENFINVTNTPGLNNGRQYPLCPQGFTRTDDQRCVQFCRGCKTGICENGFCIHV